MFFDDTKKMAGSDNSMSAGKWEYQKNLKKGQAGAIYQGSGAGFIL
jgi:hypothetical protein